MPNAEFEKKTKLLFILLENPTGLRYNEVCKIATAAKDKDGEKNRWYIGARGTVDRLLKELTKPPSPLLVKDRPASDKYARYTIGLVEPIRQLFSEGGPQLSSQIDKFLKILYKNCDFKDKKQRESCWDLGNSFLNSEFAKAVLISSILFHYFSDNRVRELWLHSQGYIFDAVFQKLNEITEKFYGIKNFTTCALENSDETASTIASEIEPLLKKIAETDKKTLDLICQSNMPDNVKGNLVRLFVGSRPLTQAISKEEKTARRIFIALEEAKKNIE